MMTDGTLLKSAWCHWDGSQAAGVSKHLKAAEAKHAVCQRCTGAWWSPQDGTAVSTFLVWPENLS